MSHQHQVKAHKVDARKITAVQPLMSAAKILSPDAGLLLVLGDGTKHSWVAEKSGTVPAIGPAIGDWLVKDDVLNVIYAVPAAKFGKLFSAAKE